MGWHDIPIADVAEKLQTNIACGLEPSQVRRRLKKFGANVAVPETGKSFFALLAAGLSELDAIITLAAVAVSVVACALKQLGVWSAVGVLLLAIIRLAAATVPAVKARRRAAALFAASVPSAVFLRERAEIRGSAATAVPGDIIVIRAGDEICADARLIEADRLGCDESAVFGAEGTVFKNPYAAPDSATLPQGWTNMVFAGSFAVCGRATAIVVATGADTCAARQRRGTLAPPSEPPALQKELDRLRLRFYTAAILADCVLVALPILGGTPVFSAVATGLCALAAALTVTGLFDADSTLGQAADNLRRSGIVFKKQNYLEKCAPVSVLFTDIFDIYTDGELSVGEYWTPLDCDRQTPLQRAEQQNTLLKAAVVALGKPDRDWQRAVFDAMSVRLPTQQVLDMFRREFEFQFGSGATGVVQAENKLVLALTCAPWSELAGRCEAGEDFYRAAEAMERDGLRVYAAALKKLPILPVVAVREEIECQMHPVGLMGLTDSLKPSVRAQMESCRAAGITPVIISPASNAMVGAYAVKMGLVESADEVVSGKKLDNMSHAELEEELENITVYSELDSAARQRVIKAWKNTGHTVAAEFADPACAPLLRQADVGFGDERCGLIRAAARAVSSQRGSGAPAISVRFARRARSALTRCLSAAIACAAASLLLPLIFTCLKWEGAEPTLLLGVTLLALGVMVPCLPRSESRCDDGNAPPSGSLLPRKYGLRGLLGCAYILAASVCAGLLGAAENAATAACVIAFSLAVYMTVLSAASGKTLFAKGVFSKKLVVSAAAAVVITAVAVLIFIGAAATGWGGITVSTALLSVALGLGALPVSELVKLFTAGGRKTEDE